MPVLLLPFPIIDPVLVSVGPFAVRWYALSYIIGILLGWLYVRSVIRNDRYWNGKAPLTATDYDDFIVWVTLGIILGGRIGYILFYNLPHFLAHPIEMLEVWKGGMSFHGGFLGCVTVVALFSWKRNIPFLTLGDLTCAGGPIGLFLGRLANFANAELWGRTSDAPWAMIFPGAGPLPRHPSQLYEAATEGVLLFVILAAAIRMGALKRPGLIIGLFAIFYALFRSFCEFFREPDPQLGFLWGGMTMGMLLSVPLLLAGLGFVVIALRRTARAT